MPASVADNAPPHNYDHRYFINHDAFRRERSKLCKKPASSSGDPRPIDATSNKDDDEKNTADDSGRDAVSSLPISKRPKIMQ